MTEDIHIKDPELADATINVYENIFRLDRELNRIRLDEEAKDYQEPMSNVCTSCMQKVHTQHHECVSARYYDPLLRRFMPDI